MDDASNAFFTQLQHAIIAGESAERVSIRRTDDLLSAAAVFRKTLDDLLLEMQIEQELYSESLSQNQIQA
ncbi:MAG: ATP-dependent DNA helicase, partial [Niameybacter sp.]